MKLHPIPALILACTPALMGADVQSFAGHGTAPAEKTTFGQAKENQKALDRAQLVAVQDALQQALVKLVGVNQLEPAKVASLGKDLADHSATLIRDQAVTESRMDGLTATVNVKLKIDFTAMKEYLENKGISLTQAFEQKFKVVVLSYTAEGADPDRSKPQVLHEEVRLEHQSVAAEQHQDSSSAGYAHQQGQSNHAADGYGAMGGAAHASGSGHAQQQSSGASLSAQSLSYLRITDYADASKRGTSSGNEVRALLSGAFTREGLSVVTIDVPFAGQEFQSEDEFVNQVLAAVRKHAEVKPEDCVAIAVNSLTPARGHQWTSKVSFHFARVQDGLNLIPADAIVKRSEATLATDDEGKTQATTMAVAAMNTQLPLNIRKGLQRLQREAATASPAAAGVYLIEIQNIQDRSVLVKVKQYLRQENFTFKSDSRAGGTVETLTLSLGTRSPEEIKDVLDGLPSSLELLSKDDAGAKLRVR